MSRTSIVSIDVRGFRAFGTVPAHFELDAPLTVAHGGNSQGKTSLAESLLFATGAITRLGKIEEGNTVADFDEDEQARGLSIYSALLAIEYGEHKINVLDAPGYVDFMGEAKNAVRVADTAVVVVDAVSGPEVGTELAFDYAEEFKLPIVVVINKMDRENANFANVLSALAERFADYRFDSTDKSVFKMEVVQIAILQPLRVAVGITEE